MTSVSLTLTHQACDALCNYYARYRQETSSDYIRDLFVCESFRISVYKSGKVLFQGIKAQTEASKWGKSTHSHKLEIPYNSAIIGTDEVGNGSYFGGLVVVASFTTPTDYKYLRQLGVDDSKKLTDATICRIAPSLSKNIHHKSLVVSPKKYNQAIASGYNAVSIKVALHNQAIHLLLEQGLTPDHIVIDAFTSPRNYQTYLAREKHPVTQEVSLIQQAESHYLAVAASSIMARALFLEQLSQLSDACGISLPSGAGERSDLVASQLLEAGGMALLETLAKSHFKNTQKARTILAKKE